MSADDEDDDEVGAKPKRRRRPPPPERVSKQVWAKFLDLLESGERDMAKVAAACGASERTVWRWKKRAESAKAQTRRGGKLEAAPPELDDDPEPGQQPGWDHMGVARRAAASDKVHVRDRLRAVQIIEQRRQWSAEHEREGTVDWATVKLEDIPHEHRARLAGVLAEVLIEAKAPALGLADTTEAQAVAHYLIGVMLHPDDAEEVVRGILSPALAAGLKRAEELVADRERGARSVAAGGSEVSAEEFLSHV